MKLYEELGGEAALRAIVERFVDRCFDDVMIGFLFQRADRQRIKDKEQEFAAVHLGASVTYTGRPLATAHAPHRIFGGQFMRRLTLLEQVLREQRAPEHIIQHWLAHTLALRDQITVDGSGECAPSGGAA